MTLINIDNLQKEYDDAYSEFRLLQDEMQQAIMKMDEAEEKLIMAKRARE